MGAKGTRSRAAPTGTVQKLLERENELGTIEAAMAAARAAEGRLLYIEAHAGIGKSRLLEAAGELGAGGGLRVLGARASELERSHAFGVVLQLFEPALATASAAEREHLLGGSAALARPLLEREGGGGSSAEEQLFALLHGLYWLTSNLAESRPLLLAVDDIHWSDRASLRFLLYLALRLVELPVVVLVSARPDEPGAPTDLLRQLKAHPASEPLRPAALSRGGVEALVERRMGTAATRFVDACATATGGNPYLLNELLADVADRGIAPTVAGARAVAALAPDAVLE
ncbi:MAG: AAA family ATPase, partial [Solirubrobacterales bacterium]